MNPLTLRLKNVGRFADLEIDLPEGLLAVVGSNGSGKSTLVGAIELALFADGSRDLADCLSPWADRLEIELEFEHAGERYRVRRGYVGGARGKATLDFDWCSAWSEEHGSTWDPRTREKASETQQLINRTLGLSRRTFGASAFLGQGNAGAFPEATAADRKGMLGEILDPHGFWPHVASCAAAERRSAEQSILVAQARIAEGQEQVEVLPDLRTQAITVAEEAAYADTAVVTLEREVAAAQAALAEAQAAAERVRTLTAERDAAAASAKRTKDDLFTAEHAGELLKQRQIDLNLLDAAGVPVEHLEAKVEEQRRLTEARAEALRRRDNAHRERNDVLARITTIASQGVADKVKHANLILQADELEQHPHEQHTCETCGQTLPDEARAKVIHGLRESAEAALLKAQDALAQVETLELRAADMLKVIAAIVIPEVPASDFAEQLTQARKTEARRIELGVLIKSYEEKATRLDELRIAHDTARARLLLCEEALRGIPIPRPADLAESLEAAATRLRIARTALAEIQQRQARLEQQIETLTLLESSIEGSRRLVAETQQQIDLLKLAERAFGRDGIPALIVESVIGVIEAETNRLLEMMPTSDGETFRVELRTQRALKTAEHLKETLDILVWDRDGERTYETYSGGEQARLNICLRIALALLLADRRGAESRLLVVDELEYLDALGQEQLIDVIQSVGHRFDRTIVVSHHPGIRDAFNNTLQIVKDNGVSRVLSDEPVRVPA